MTTRRDARAGDASGGRADGDDRDAGDTHDELAGEDAKLRAMRSVWLAMRDEEPSSGGLAELMAAARGKAAELAPRPAWWQRAVAGLRRPPVLAFATVLVLLGGAMIVGRQVERAGAPMAVGSASDALRTPPEMVGGTAPAAVPEAAGQGQRVRQQISAAPPPAPEPTVENKLRASETIESDRPRTPPPSVVRPRPPAKSPVNDERAGDGGAPATAPSALMRAGAVASPPSEGAADARSPSAPSEGATLGRSEPPTRTKPSREHGGGTPSVLYRRCEAAATRGDCAEVRRLIDQISTTDPGYRARVTRASRIAKCLAE